MTFLRSKPFLAVSGVSIYLLGTYYAYQKLKPSENSSIDMHQKDAKLKHDVSNNWEAQPDKSYLYNQKAAEYDAEIGMDEFVMGLLLMRRWLIRHAQGNTLEIAAGTSRNLPYYDPSSLSSLTLTDLSASMLSSTTQKLSQYPGLTSKTTTIQADSRSLPFPESSFDTVISTFSLCSVSNPVQVLQELSRVVKPSGQILLLEHGRSRYRFWNEILDKSADRHAQKWGCWFNRDLEKILELSGIEVEYIKRWHFGTTYYVIAKKKGHNEIQRD